MTSHTLTTHVKSATWIQERAGEVIRSTLPRAYPHFHADNNHLQLKQQDIDAPELLLEKSHPVWLVFKNITDFPLSKTDQHFDTGDWFDNVVPEIAPWSVAGIAAADQWAGCTGGASFKLHLENDLDFDFSIVRCPSPYLHAIAPNHILDKGSGILQYSLANLEVGFH
jgi:hypothetical protein